MKREICHFCRHFQSSATGRFEHGICVERSIVRLNGRGSSTFLRIMAAREVCDREGDGHFVYFEPKTPTAGAFVQITRETPRTLAKAA